VHKDAYQQIEKMVEVVKLVGIKTNNYKNRSE